MPYPQLQQDSKDVDTRETIADAADRIFPKYLSLTEELFVSFEALAQPSPLPPPSELEPLSDEPFDALQTLLPASDEEDRPSDYVSMQSSNSNTTVPEHPTEILRKLLALDSQLQDFVNRLEQHQNTQRQIESVRLQLLDQEVGIMEFSRRLGEKQDDLEELVTVAKETIEAASKAHEAPLNINEIISYASRVSKYTMASDNAARPHEPPVPQDIHMRASLLFQQGHAVDTHAEEKASDEVSDVISHFTFMSQPLSSPKKEEPDRAHTDHADLLDLEL
ncbi:uncharacterized protein SPPG_00736 [Spizellomyces punctatus DAOM BR117]|uniref:Mediator of RNA polymerase II transcription subunit 4 n=1 Tax=Spizellomyces punctatus (strain DAOM BR117) TaxID=645134 RepID=A0A0L0HVZ9_SPIPD|nr:uncharacterized protein SPPG_00736 [Spizellomyces punctatus DAOM BR117]KND05060.1 hypothetical protein SPPG_00736 [Spizellomyces punctatus DAOM BR117]|eukprot:XP_016613099.1 hypothetical protein SPPG_00736 [Spizellomyces punctatus DAOM BR117]